MGNEGGSMRPGTAPKQAMLNNFAGGESGGNFASQTQKRGDRPMSPYSKAYGTQNSMQYQGPGQPKKRASSKRGVAPQGQIISSN